jgi:hypothetical protein
MGNSFKKYASIHIEFDSIKELKYALSKISDEIAQGSKHDRKMIVNCFCEYQTSVLIEPDFRIEEINGKQCMIFKSKMNKHGK